MGHEEFRKYAKVSEHSKHAHLRKESDTFEDLDQPSREKNTEYIIKIYGGPGIKNAMGGGALAEWTRTLAVFSFFSLNKNRNEGNKNLTKYGFRGPGTSLQRMF
jgi:hypothetical protein